MRYPVDRPSRLRQSEPLRRLVRETHLAVDQLVMPLFVRPGKNVRAPIPSMPGQFQLSVDQVVRECQELRDHRVPAVLLFGMATQKDDKATGAYAKDGLIQQAIAAIKAQVPDLLVMTDVCLCAYTSHGHCGLMKMPAGASRGKTPAKKAAARKADAKKGKIITTPQPAGSRGPRFDDAATLDALAMTALSHAQAGADVVAPSDMMDGRVAAIREALDGSGCSQVPIMSYAAKFASSLCAPFRQAVDSTPSFGDRKSYQMDPANGREALHEVELDIREGADIVIVKPALAYLDVITKIKQQFNVPVAAFSVSGEYAMVKAAAARGWIIERPTWLELLLGMRRAGADLIITYWAKDAAKLLQER